MIIATDADMVLFEFDETWRQVAEKTLQRPVPRLCNSYSMALRYGLSSKEYHKTWAAFHKTEAWADCIIIPSAINAVHRMLEHGHEVHVVTSMPQKTAHLRRRQLDAIGLNRAELHITWNPYRPDEPPIQTKKEVLNRIRPRFFADDRWDHCREAHETNVPYVAFIESTHDGDGYPVHGVHSHPDLAHAFHIFTDMDTNDQAPTAEVKPDFVWRAGTRR